MQINLRRLQPSETQEALGWLKQNHYLRSTPPGFIALLEFTLAGRRIGVMQLGRPTARTLDADSILELTRMHFVDDTPKSTESHALSMMRKWVRTWLPWAKLLLAYSDPQVGHKGTVYSADGWAPFGKTANSHGYGWKSREGRRDECVGSKLRWVRSP